MSDTWRPQSQGFMQANIPGGQNPFSMSTGERAFNMFNKYKPGFYRPSSQPETNIDMYRNIGTMLNEYMNPMQPRLNYKVGGNTYNLPRMQVNNPTFAFNADESFQNSLANVGNDPEYIDGVRPPGEPDINAIDPKALGEPDSPDSGSFSMTRKKLIDPDRFLNRLNRWTNLKKTSDMAKQQRDENLEVNSNTVMGVLPNSTSEYGDSLVNTPGMGAAFRANDYTAGTFSQGVGMREAYPLMWNQPNRVQTGGSAFVDYNVGDEDYWTDEQIQEFISLGGQVDILED